MTAPPVDPRDRSALAAQLTALAQRYSPWRPGAAPDPGSALVAVAARFAELVVDRINRAPERNYLAFLNLIGVRQEPPVAARVPLTFTLAEGGPATAAVPAGTRVTAPPLPGDADDTVFETEADLVVTRAQLCAVVVDDVEDDTTADATAQATGLVDAPFAAFGGDRPVPHQLFLACDPVLTAPGVKDVTLLLSAPVPAALGSWPVSWAYWDGAAWAPATSTASLTGNVWRVTLAQLPPVPVRELAGITAGWVRAQLDVPLPPGRSGVAPESVAVGGRAPQDDVGGVFPFGDATPGRWFYLSVDEAVAVGGAAVRLQVQLARAGAAAARPVRLNWSYRVGSEWKDLGRSGSDADQVPGAPAGFTDTSRALTTPGTVSFRVPVPWPLEAFRGRLGRWLRVELADDGGGYATSPQLAGLVAGYAWDLPSLGALTVATGTPPPSVPPPAAFAGDAPLDVTRELYPFGEGPHWGDTFYLACPPDLLRTGRGLELAVTLANATANGPVTQVRTDGNPGIAWEAWTGTGWQPVVVDNSAFAFTTSATLQLTLPEGVTPTSVNGEEQSWVRIRLVRGDYGKPADYVKKDDGTYEPVRATYAPPVVSALTWRVGRGRPAETPVTACVSVNDFVSRVHRGPGADPAATFAPFVPGPDSDPGLYLGFDQPFAPHPVSVYLQVEPPAPEEVAADRFAEIDPSTRAVLVWEYRGQGGWQPLDAVDGSDGLAGRGTVTFVGPPDQVATERFEQRWYWVRARWSHGQFPVAPRLRRVIPNTVWAGQAATVDGEVLGSGTGAPGQVLTTSQTPLLAGHQVTVRETDDAWVAWEAVDDFHGSGPLDRHYTADPVSGEIRFGDGRAGRCLPAGANNVRIAYRSGGGTRGNRAPHTIITLGSSIPYVDAVTNHEPAQGGLDVEPVERLRARGPLMLRHGNRAITARDVEDIAFAASAEVARVAAVPPGDFDPKDLWLDPQAPRPTTAHAAVDAGRFGVIVVPDSAQARPAPSLALLRRVEAHLRACCPATAQVWVAGPEWVQVQVTATVVPASPSIADAVANAVRAALERYLHPLTGGPDGAGWAFGRKPHRSEAFAVITAVAGVDHVRALRIDLLPESDELGGRLQIVLGRSLVQSAAQPPAPDLQRWLDRALVYSGRHDITTTVHLSPTEG
jgi:Baseplate J-like protein